MISNPPSDGSVAVSATAAVVQSGGRRRLMRGSIGAAPVLLTLMSQPSPANAAGFQCLSASATISANASGKAGIASGSSGCNGIGPLGWLNFAAPYPAGVTPATLFSNYFSGGGYLAGATFGSVLAEANTLAGNEPSKLRRNLVAAVLNILDGRLASSIVTIAKLISIWNQLGTSSSATWVVNGTGQTWNAQQTNVYWFNQHLFLGAV